MGRKLRETVVLGGVIYPVGTAEKDIDGKVEADVWDGESAASDEPTGYAAQGADDLKAEADKRGLTVEDAARLAQRAAIVRITLVSAL